MTIVEFYILLLNLNWRTAPPILDEPEDNSVLTQRRNVYDNDEFDVFRKDAIDTSRIHKGKRWLTEAFSVFSLFWYFVVKLFSQGAYIFALSDASGSRLDAPCKEWVMSLILRNLLCDLLTYWKSTTDIKGLS